MPCLQSHIRATHIFSCTLATSKLYEILQWDIAWRIKTQQPRHGWAWVNIMRNGCQMANPPITKKPTGYRLPPASLELGLFNGCNTFAPSWMFLSLDILFEYWIEHIIFGLLYFMFRFSTRIFYRGVPGFDCPCGVWCCGLTTYTLCVGPLLGNLVWNDSGFVSLTLWRTTFSLL